MADRPYQHFDDYINTTRDISLRRKMQAKLSELIAEENRRFTDGLPF